MQAYSDTVFDWDHTLGIQVIMVCFVVAKIIAECTQIQYTYSILDTRDNVNGIDFHTYILQCLTPTSQFLTTFDQTAIFDV